jgi:hypothetical protein
MTASATFRPFPTLHLDGSSVDRISRSWDLTRPMELAAELEARTTEGIPGDPMPQAIWCAHCDEPATTVVVELAGIVAYLDVCERHLADLLRGVRPLATAQVATPTHQAS